MMFFNVFLLFALFAGLQTAEIDFRLCHGTLSQCSVRGLEINPCVNYRRGHPCQLSRGTKASMTFKYTPSTSFSSVVPVSMLYGEFEHVNTPLFDMNLNACLYTPCPLMRGETSPFKFDFHVGDHYALKTYMMQMLIYDVNSFEECCFKFELQIVDAESIM